jgi:transposase
MDNASFHRKEVLRELCKEAKVFIEFLPAYSPDYNPIEKSWANLKRYLRDNVDIKSPDDSVYNKIDYAVFFYFICSKYLK